MVHPRIYCCIFKPSVVALYRVLTPELWHFSFLTWERFFFLIAFNSFLKISQVKKKSFLKISQVFHRICWRLKLSAAIARSVVGPSPSHDFQVRACFREPLKVAAAYFAWILPLCSSACVGCQVMFFLCQFSNCTWIYWCFNSDLWPHGPIVSTLPTQAMACRDFRPGGPSSAAGALNQRA